MLRAPLVGLQFQPPARAIVPVLPGGTELILEPEPDNEVDPNAVKVLVEPRFIPMSQRMTLDTQLPGFGVKLEDLLALHQVPLGYIAAPFAKEVGDALRAALSSGTPYTCTLSFNPQGQPRVVLTILERSAA